MGLIQSIYINSQIIWQVILSVLTAVQIPYAASFIWTDNVFALSKTYDELSKFMSAEEYGTIGIIIGLLNLAMLNSRKLRFIFPITVAYWGLTFLSFYFSSGGFSPVTSAMFAFAVIISVGYIISGGWAVNKKETTNNGEGGASIDDSTQ